MIAGHLFFNGFPRAHFSHLFVDESAQVRVLSENMRILCRFVVPGLGSSLLASSPQSVSAHFLSRFFHPLYQALTFLTPRPSVYLLSRDSALLFCCVRFPRLSRPSFSCQCCCWTTACLPSSSPATTANWAQLCIHRWPRGADWKCRCRSD